MHCFSITYGVLMDESPTRWALVFRDLRTITHDKENSRRREKDRERARYRGVPQGAAGQLGRGHYGIREGVCGRVFVCVCVRHQWVSTLRVGSGDGAVCAGAAVDAVARSPGEGKTSGAQLMRISGENWEILFVKAAPKRSCLEKRKKRLEERKRTGELEA